jgi:hypothetical protein
MYTFTVLYGISNEMLLFTYSLAFFYITGENPYFTKIITLSFLHLTISLFCCSTLLLFKKKQPPFVLYIFLCTRASLYAHYRLLLIFSEFWMGGGGRVGSRRGRIEGAESEGENKRSAGGGQSRAIKLLYAP